MRREELLLQFFGGLTEQCDRQSGAATQVGILLHCFFCAEGAVREQSIKFVFVR